MFSDLASSLSVIAVIAAGILIGSSLVGVLSIAGPWLLMREVSEASRLRVLFYLQLAGWLASLVLAACVFESESGQRMAASIHWRPAEAVELELGVVIDGLAASLLVGITSLTGIVQHFSFRYLHRDGGNARFFFLLELFQLGMILLVSASHLVGLIAGWELVGLSSTFLIAYFQERRVPVENAMVAFVSYRLCDVGLVLGSALLVHALGSSSIADWPTLMDSARLHAFELELAGICFVVATLGKSAQLPASSWLPRAMEGPTPSSAIFYGALSIHAGVYLLIRLQPLLAVAVSARVLLLIVGGVTALYAAFVGRVEADVKSRLAHASMAQAGFMLIEIGLGLSTLAAWHLGAHACWRTWQFLRAPSALHDAHRAHPFLSHTHETEASAGRASATVRWYALRLDHFGLDEVVSRVLIRPARNLAELLQQLDPWSDRARRAARGTR